MKITSSTVPEDYGHGSMVVVPQDADDMWTLYNHIHPGDVVEGTTTRKVIRKSDNSTYRKTIRAVLRVTKTDYDARSASLQIAGTFENEIEDVSPGAAHTLDVQVNRQLKITKDEWNKLEVDDLNDACDMDKRAELGAIIMEDGVAHVCIVTSNMTILKAKVEVSIPKKTAYESSIKKIGRAHERFFKQLYTVFSQSLPLDTLKALLIASPAFYATEFKNYLFEEAALKSDKRILRFKDKTVIAHASSGYLQSLKEVMKDPNVVSHLSSAKYGHQLQMLENFYTIMNRDDMRAWYGPKHVAKAVEMGAVDSLMVSDSLFRSDDVAERKEYIAMVEEVKNSGGSVEIFSSLHDAGQQLDDISGIAAILKFPLPELQDIESEDEDED
ncbi:uncharacterized protein SAPINGB_P002085 [Magnusiomyces paraingens]|uniref:Protein DOM34 homolog n=1 Tax=Magnusiomyces paraingens TaxID=2606893 RepID=A0A5E8BK38_9ASCO|nr:uncharacterized protein SAPINGB_P002085 [Saprochaete ingens]VVT49062.1 unnamed protein product [Saprochaete ingens]